jgi:hypothetical protein
VEATNAANSGVDQPIFPHCAINGEWALERGGPKVLAVVRWAPPETNKTMPPVLRWYVARLDSPSALAKATPSPATLPTWLGIVLNCAEHEPTPANDADVQHWFDEARSGQRPVLDVFSLNGSDSTTLTFGSEYHYTTELDEDDVATDNNALAVEPDFPSQVSLKQRTAGITFHCDESGWSLERDDTAPTVVTDTCGNAILEWPLPRSDKADQQRKITTVCMQRPAFSIQRARDENDLPVSLNPFSKNGNAISRRLSATRVFILKHW